MGGLFHIAHCYVLKIPTVGQNWAALFHAWLVSSTCWQDLFKQGPSSELKGSDCAANKVLWWSPPACNWGVARDLGDKRRVLGTMNLWLTLPNNKATLGMQQESIIARNSKFPIRMNFFFHFKCLASSIRLYGTIHVGKSIFLRHSKNFRFFTFVQKWYDYWNFPHCAPRFQVQSFSKVYPTCRALCFGNIQVSHILCTPPHSLQVTPYGAPQFHAWNPVFHHFPNPEELKAHKFVAVNIRKTMPQKSLECG